jgi:hypothetical protein
MECLSWALRAKEQVVAGGVVVTRTMIKGYQLSTQEEIDAGKAGTPEDWSRELAARSRTRQRQSHEGAGDERQRESA